MIICPLEGAVLFGGCPVVSCMWNNGKGRCTSTAGGATGNAVNENEDSSSEELDAIRNVKHFVTVGVFIEATTGRDIQSIHAKDIPSEEKFSEWLSKKGSTIRGQQIPYGDIVRQIKAAL
jgi:hypothetical protein